MGVWALAGTPSEGTPNERTGRRRLGCCSANRGSRRGRQRGFVRFRRGRGGRWWCVWLVEGGIVMPVSAIFLLWKYYVV